MEASDLLEGVADLLRHAVVHDEVETDSVSAKRSSLAVAVQRARLAGQIGSEIDDGDR